METLNNAYVAVFLHDIDDKYTFRMNASKEFMENLKTIKKRLEILKNDVELESDEDRKADKQAIYEMLEKMVLVIEKGGKKKICKK